jgi:hypothetical protein
MGKDTDGTEWRTVRFTVDVQVMADNDEDALYYAKLSLQDEPLDCYTIEVLRD